jgi:tetraacyldisaccharide 4'-kinase
LREPVADGLHHADAVIIVGDDRMQAAEQVRKLRPGLPLFQARLVATPDSAAALAGQRLLAFAGIGRPEKFFDSLRALGCDLAATRTFDDHHPYDAKDVAALAALAAQQNARLVTTAKDAVRWPVDGAEIAVLDVEIAWDDEAALDRLLAERLARALPDAWPEARP